MNSNKIIDVTKQIHNSAKINLKSGILCDHIIA